MNTTPEMTLLNYCEVFGHKETARKMREIVDKQRIPWDKIRIEASFTPTRDANADCENPGPDLFAANAGITPEQARFAYNHAIDAPDPLDMAEEGPTRAVPLNSAGFGHKIGPMGSTACPDFEIEPESWRLAKRGPLTCTETQWHVGPDARVEEYFYETPLPEPQKGWTGWLVNKAGRLFRRTLPKHTYILSDGTPRQEPCCR